MTDYISTLLHSNAVDALKSGCIPLESGHGRDELDGKEHPIEFVMASDMDCAQRRRGRRHHELNQQVRALRVAWAR